MESNSVKNSTRQKSVLMDSSSVIIIYKAGMLHFLIDGYRLKIALSVYRELTRAMYPGAEEFERYCRDRFFECPELDRDFMLKSVPRELLRLRGGEKDTIALYYSGAADFIIIDDGKGAAYCRDHQIPYISALLVPQILFLTGIVNAEASVSYFNRIIKLGRYSGKVIEVARNCSDGSLSQFCIN